MEPPRSRKQTVPRVFIEVQYTNKVPVGAFEISLALKSVLNIVPTKSGSNYFFLPRLTGSLLLKVFFLHDTI